MEMVIYFASNSSVLCMRSGLGSSVIPIDRHSIQLGGLGLVAFYIQQTLISQSWVILHVDSWLSSLSMKLSISDDMGAAKLLTPFLFLEFH